MKINVVARGTTPPTGPKRVEVTRQDALVITGLPKDAARFSRRVAERYATDANRDGTISAAEAQAFMKAQGLGEQPGFFARLLMKLGLKKPATELRLAVGPQASPALVAARALQEYAGEQARFDWTSLELATAKDGVKRVTIKDTHKNEAQTYVLRPEKNGGFVVADLIGDGRAQIARHIEGEYDRTVANVIWDEIVERAPGVSATAVDWKSFERHDGFVDSDDVRIKLASGEELFINVAFGGEDGEIILVRPGQLTDLLMAVSGHDDEQHTHFAVGMAIMDTLGKASPTGWPQPMDWLTLELEPRAGGAYEAKVSEAGGKAHRFLATPYQGEYGTDYTARAL